MDDERLRELENWVLTERSQLTESENVLLDAIAEACLAVRRAWEEQKTHEAALSAWRNKAETYHEELEKDRLAMEGADVELAVGDESAAEKARAILSERLKSHRDVE